MINELTNQPLTEREEEIVTEGYRLYDEFRMKNTNRKANARTARKIALIEDPDQDAPGTPAEEKAPQLHTLRSTIVNCIADQMDNIPEAVITPERPDTQDLAEDLTDMVQRVMEINHYDALHRLRTEDFFVTGTAATQVIWDPDMARGHGEIALINCPIESLEWDPQADNIQEGRAMFRSTWHPRQYYEEHYPDTAEYITTDSYFPIDADPSDQEDSIMLLEYWYRKWDHKKKRYVVHVAYLAGHVLLYSSETEDKNGLYMHGLYPFVFDVYTRVMGRADGNGMAIEFATMQRAINRYAKYIDENARASAKMRLLVNNGAGLSDEDLKDWNKQIVKGEVINESAVRWFQSAPLSAQVNLQMNNFMDMLKQDSGQNQFNRGEGGLGVTAATAIQSLQEAGGKTSRYRTETLKSGFREIVEQVLWLIRQYYTDHRKIYVTGRKDGELREVTSSPEKLFGKEDEMPYAVRVQVQRRNPLKVQAENETIMNAANVLAQSETPMQPLTLIKLLQMDGKDRILHALEEDDGNQKAALMQQIATLQQQGEEMNAQYQQQLAQMQQVIEQQASALAETSSDQLQ